MDTQIVFAMMLSVASLCQSAKPALSEAATVSQVWSPTSRGAGVWIENRGQWPDSVRFACCVAGNSLFLESDALVVDSQHPTDAKSRVAVRLSFEDACADVIVEGVDRCDGRYSFFIGSNAEKWLRKVASFQGVRLRGIYPGIDVLMMADGSKVKYDIHVQPGADLAQMVVRLEGAAATRWSEDGTLVIETSPRSPASIGSLVHSTGVSWQTLPTGELRFVQAHWAPLCEKRFALIVPERDLSLPLVIDPELAWSTYLGSATFAGTGDVAFAVTTDSRGDVIVVGKADAFDFPHTPGVTARGIWSTRSSAKLVHPGVTQSAGLVRASWSTPVRANRSTLVRPSWST